MKLSQHRLEWRAVKLLLVYFKLWKICANFPPNKKYITMAKRTQTNEIVNVSASASRAKDKWVGGGMRGGGEPMHKHDENVLQFAVKFARCVYFQIMRKLFAYAPNKGAGWGMLWKGRGKWETRLLSRRMRTSWQQPAAQQLSIYFCFFASIVLRIRAKCNFSYLHNCRQSADSADSSK